MYCLLCHEKIPRLRAWRTKSQFCSDECAAKYKSQTMERLLTDQAEVDAVPPPLDAPAVEDLDIDLTAEPPPDLTGATEANEADEIAAFEQDVFRDDFDEPASLPSGSGGEPYGGGEDELWMLADEVGMNASSQVDQQSAEDALQALAELSRDAETRRTEKPADEIETAAQQPPEPDFGSDMDLLDEAELELATQPPPEGVVAPQDAPFLDTSSLLDELVREGDWNERAQAATTDAAPESVNELEAVVAELETVEKAADAVGADAVAEAVEPEPDGGPAMDASAPAEEDLSPDDPADAEDLTPREEDFAASIQAAADQLIQNGGPNVVAFPDAESEDHDAATADEPPAQEAVPAPPAAAKRKGRRAPKLRPAAVMAGLFPTPSGHDLEPATSWEGIVSQALPRDLKAAWRTEAQALFLNGSGAAPLSSERRIPLHCGLWVRLDSNPAPAAQSSAEDWKLAVPTAEPVSPQTSVQWPASASSALRGLGFGAGPAGRPIPAEPAAQFSEQGFPPVDLPPAVPAAPCGFFFDAVAEATADGASEDDGDWFTDIEGFESL